MTKIINKRNLSVGISLPEELIDLIDEDRGDISRSRYLLRTIEKTFSKNTITNSRKNSLPVEESDTTRIASKGNVVKGACCSF